MTEVMLLQWGTFKLANPKIAVLKPKQCVIKGVTEIRQRAANARSTDVKCLEVGKKPQL